MVIACVRPIRRRCFLRRSGERGNNKYKYCIFAMYEGFDPDKSLEGQSALYDGYPKTWKDFYEEVVNDSRGIDPSTSTAMTSAMLAM